VVGAAKDASGVGDKLDVYNLGVISAADLMRVLSWMRIYLSRVASMA